MIVAGTVKVCRYIFRFEYIRKSFKRPAFVVSGGVQTQFL